MGNEIRLLRSKECIDDCSSGGHEFANGAEGMVITTPRNYEVKEGFGNGTLTGVEWDVFRNADADEGTRYGEIVEVSYLKTEFEGDDETDLDSEEYLCRCCQHELRDAEKPADPNPEDAKRKLAAK